MCHSRPAERPAFCRGISKRQETRRAEAVAASKHARSRRSLQANGARKTITIDAVRSGKKVLGPVIVDQAKGHETILSSRSRAAGGRPLRSEKPVARADSLCRRRPRRRRGEAVVGVLAAATRRGRHVGTNVAVLANGVIAYSLGMSEDNCANNSLHPDRASNRSR